MYAAWLVVAAGCSDDGLIVQDQNSSSTAAGDSSGTATAPVTTMNDQGDTVSDESPTTTLGDPDTGSTTGLSDDDSTSEPGTTGGSSSTGILTGTTEGSTTDATGTTEGSTTGEVCDPITEDASGINAMCLVDADCPEGYTCQPFAGIILQTTCQILCEQDCDCPMGHVCFEVTDKVATWHQCG